MTVPRCHPNYQDCLITSFTNINILLITDNCRPSLLVFSVGYSKVFFLLDPSCCFHYPTLTLDGLAKILFLIFVFKNSLSNLRKLSIYFLKLFSVTITKLSYKLKNLDQIQISMLLSHLSNFSCKVIFFLFDSFTNCVLYKLNNRCTIVL